MTPASEEMERFDKALREVELDEGRAFDFAAVLALHDTQVQEVARLRVELDEAARSMDEYATRMHAECDALQARAEAAEASFKNFHRNLCARFGYTHDERDWRRDQISLEEHIARKIERPAEPPASVREAFGYEGLRREFTRWHAEAYPSLDVTFDHAWSAFHHGVQWTAALASRPTSEPVGKVEADDIDPVTGLKVRDLR